ncbi:MAG TPA: response regulator [Vicinamibacterales bacterium]|nr:response regulator [Vicinamibacterales bacterium]
MSTKTASGGTETILLVEDEPAIRGLVAHALRKAGYHVLEARNGIEALELFDRAGRVDLLLTDVQMPYLRGTDLTMKLRQKAPKLKTLLISGYVGRAQAGVDVPLLEKPFARDALLKAVRETLDAAGAA